MSNFLESQQQQRVFLKVKSWICDGQLLGLWRLWSKFGDRLFDTFDNKSLEAILEAVEAAEAQKKKRKRKKENQLLRMGFEPGTK